MATDEKYPESEVTYARAIVHRRNVREMPRCYQTVAEIHRAVKQGTFDISRTMHMDKNGTIYFACLNVDAEATE